MKKILLFIHVVYIFLFVSGSVFAIGERTIQIGGTAGWRNTSVRTGIAEASSVRPHSVLLLSSVAAPPPGGYSAATGVMGNFSAVNASILNDSRDMFISFDEREPGLFKDSAGFYRVTTPAGIEAANRSFARAGSGAALFGSSGAAGPVTVVPQSRNALFAPDSRIRDFTIEFWLHPLNLENGERIMSWVSSRQINGNYAVQRIQCTASRNRLHWSFVNFFTSTNGTSHINIEISGNSHVVPKTWSHHLVRFDAATGMVEYLVNGNIESIVYATSTGRENSEVYSPIAGNNGIFMLGETFTGFMDEFKIHRIFAGRSSVQRYIPSGGRVETGPVDLGENSSGVIRVDVRGGRIGNPSSLTGGNSTINEFRENGRFRFSDDSEMNFFIRVSNNQYLLHNSPWINFVPGAAIPGIQGRYVQIAADLYPSADGETSPYIESLRLVYMPGEPPLPPQNLTAVAYDGAVQLRWRHSADANITRPDFAGYLVYYSTVRGELFGEGAVFRSARSSSPINAGMTNNVLIEGLENGTLYFFRVAAYDNVTSETGAGQIVRRREGSLPESYIIGEFSAEVTARPLTGLQPPGIQ